MRGRGIANWLAALSLLLAVGALCFLFFWPGISLVEENGTAKALGWAIPPVMLALLGFLASLRQTRMGKSITLVAAVALLMFALVFGWGLGLAYFPAVFALVIAAATARGASPGTSPT
jgi:hypothetical protein